MKLTIIMETINNDRNKKQYLKPALVNIMNMNNMNMNINT